MITSHRMLPGNACDLADIPDHSINLIVTSPPYPMIEMWDDAFCSMSGDARGLLASGDGPGAFEAMHRALDPAWGEAFRVLAPGGFACINIGDATRSLGGEFALYPNHARIIASCIQSGFSMLPCIIWRKQTNAPNKFMGSGMLPAGAYVTLEHEYVLVFRKGGKRGFASAGEKARRARSALFWEERNQWFSDVWFDLKGTGQALNGRQVRGRSGAFPFELAYRLISMYSLQGDTVLDPFLGTGTTTLAAMAAARHSVGVEIEAELLELASERISGDFMEAANACIRRRLENHREFVRSREAARSGNEPTFRHRSVFYDFPVMTRQEKDLVLPFVRSVRREEAGRYAADYLDTPDEYFEEGTLFGSTDAAH